MRSVRAGTGKMPWVPLKVHRTRHYSMAAVRAGSFLDTVRFMGPVRFTGPVRFARFAGSGGSPVRAVRPVAKIIPRHKIRNVHETGRRESCGALDRCILHRFSVRKTL